MDLSERDKTITKDNETKGPMPLCQKDSTLSTPSQALNPEEKKTESNFRLSSSKKTLPNKTWQIIYSNLQTHNCSPYLSYEIIFFCSNNMSEPKKMALPNQLPKAHLLPCVVPSAHWAAPDDLDDLWPRAARRSCVGSWPLKKSELGKGQWGIHQCQTWVGENMNIENDMQM